MPRQGSVRAILLVLVGSLLLVLILFVILRHKTHKTLILANAQFPGQRYL